MPFLGAFEATAPLVAAIPHADKIAHAGMYAVLTGLSLWARALAGAARPGRAVLPAALAATAYGALLECLQGFTVLRDSSFWDAFANAAGAFGAAGVWLAALRRRGRQTGPA
jgi:VanZ family protein